MIEEKLWISNRFGEKLEALVRKPFKNGKFPTVVFVQGFGMDMHEYGNSFDEIAQQLNASGFLTIQFNFSYHKFLTEKTTREIALTKRAQEIDDVLSHVSGYENVDEGRIGLVAQSFGVSTILMAGRPHIRSLCFLSGLGFRPASFIQRYIAKGAVINRNGETILPGTRDKDKIVGSDFGKVLMG